MESILFEFSRIAKAAIAAITIIAMKATVSGNDVGKNPVEALAKQHNLVFAGYMALIVLGVIFTYWVWKSGNRVQEAIQTDANARIEEAKSAAATADERTKILERDNLTLRKDLSSEIGKVAGLQKDAADAKAAQQKVEIELARQREQTAKAEKSLADLRERIKPRRLDDNQRAALVRLLSGPPQGTIDIVCVMGDGEGYAFATDIDSSIKAAGWIVSGGGVSQAAYSGGNPIGFGIIVRNAITAPPYAVRIQRAFFSIGIPLNGAEDPKLPEGTVQIIVGNKPNPPN
jgi:hypothetical protein